MDRDIDAKTMWRIYRVKMFELGHSFKEIDATNLDDIGDYLGYIAEKKQAEEAMKREDKALAAD